MIRSVVVTASVLSLGLLMGCSGDDGTNGGAATTTSSSSTSTTSSTVPTTLGDGPPGAVINLAPLACGTAQLGLRGAQQGDVQFVEDQINTLQNDYRGVFPEELYDFGSDLTLDDAEEKLQALVDLCNIYYPESQLPE